MRALEAGGSPKCSCALCHSSSAQEITRSSRTPGTELNEPSATRHADVAVVTIALVQCWTATAGSAIGSRTTNRAPPPGASSM